jgi:hypothetical protein
MRFLTEDARLACAHGGVVELAPIQELVTIGGRRVLVEIDPEQRPIRRCPNQGAAIRPCITTLRVREGYSAFIRVEQRRVCLDTVTGLTDGTPPGVVPYLVRVPGQEFVEERP